MRPDLVGDTETASKWIGWAEGRLRQLKHLMQLSGRSIASQYYDLIGQGVQVSVFSCGGQDNIRIIGNNGAGIWICGQAALVSNTLVWLLEKLNLSGKPSSQKTYNTVADDSHPNSANGIVADADKSLYICGSTHVELPGHRYWQVERRDKNGNLVWQTTPVIHGMANAIAVDSTGIYIAGWQLYEPLGVDSVDHDWRVEKRSKKDGSLIWQYVISVVPGDPSSHVPSSANGIDVLNGNVVTCGQIVQPYVECRDAATGSIVWAKSLTTDGINAVDNGWYSGIRIRPLGTYAYSVGSRVLNGAGNHYEWKVERRNMADGSIDWTQTYTDAGHNTQAIAVLLLGASVYVCGYDGATPTWRVEKRLQADGSLTWSKRAAISDEAVPLAITTFKGLIYVGGWKYTPYKYSTYLEAYDSDGKIKNSDINSEYLFSEINGMTVIV